MSIDWDKEPKAVGALVAKKSNIHYPKITFVSEFHTFGCMFRGTSCEGHALSASNDCWDWIPRPVPAWSGDGFPPVGIKVMTDLGTVMTECEVIGYYQKCDGGESWIAVALSTASKNSRFIADRLVSQVFPIRTPEQIAAEERDFAVNEMIRCVKDHPGGRHGANHLTQLKIQEEACFDLYQAGYRKEVKS